jgi:AmmeMemoRadiSam system protein B
VFPGAAYATPLGSIPVDQRLRAELCGYSSAITPSAHGHGPEHAIEVHLPFLQYQLREFTLLPIVMGDQRREYCFALGEALYRLAQEHEQVLLVASSDLSHYYPSTQADQLDAVVIDDVEKLDYEALMRDLESQRTEACGGGPMVAAMLALSRLGMSSMTILHHCNSGDVTGDYSQVVGYLAAAAHE